MSGVTVGFVLLADTFDDPENARIILLSAAALVVLGGLIAAGTVWWWRSSRVEHPALGPLEVMGSRSWWKGDYAARRRRLEEARPAGAEPVDPATTAMSDPVDLKAAASSAAIEFDDLLEFPPVAAEPAVDGAAEVAADPVVESEAADEPEPADAAEPDAEVDTAKVVADDTAVTPVPRPIDPLLRLHHDA